MIDKDKKIAFLAGVIVGIFVTFIFLGGMFVIYKVGAKIFNHITQSPREEREVKVTRAPSVGKGKGFKISFENKEDLEFFEQGDGLYVEQVKDFVTEGQYALLAEYPKGATYPGLFWEVYRKDKCLDWSKGRNFVFDVHNNAEVDAVLNVKLKSSPNYPKETYETHLNLPAQQSKKVVIPLEELRGNLNVKEISYINLFINNPQENITLYFDNMRIE